MCLWTFWSKHRANDPKQDYEEIEGVPDLIVADGVSSSDDGQGYHQAFSIYEKVSSPLVYPKQPHNTPSLSPHLVENVSDRVSVEPSKELVFGEYVPKDSSPEVLKREVLQFRTLQFTEKEVPRTRNRSSPGIIESDGQDNILIQAFEERLNKLTNVEGLKERSTNEAKRLKESNNNHYRRARKAVPVLIREVLVGNNETVELPGHSGEAEGIFENELQFDPVLRDEIESDEIFRNGFEADEVFENGDEISLEEGVEIDGLTLSKWYHGNDEYPQIITPPVGTENEEEVPSIDIVDLVNVLQESRDILEGRADESILEANVKAIVETTAEATVEVSPSTPASSEASQPISCISQLQNLSIAEPEPSPHTPVSYGDLPYNPASAASFEFIQTQQLLYQRSRVSTPGSYHRSNSHPRLSSSNEQIHINASSSQQTENNSKSSRRDFDDCIEVDGVLGFLDFLNPAPSSSPNQDTTDSSSTLLKTSSQRQPTSSTSTDHTNRTERTLQAPTPSSVALASPRKYILSTFTPDLSTPSIPRIDTPDSFDELEALPKRKNDYKKPAKKNDLKDKQYQAALADMKKKKDTKKLNDVKNAAAIGKAVVGQGDRHNMVDKRSTSRKTANNVYEVEKRETQGVEHQKKSQGRTKSAKKKVENKSTEGIIKRSPAELAKLIAADIILSRDMAPKDKDYDVYVHNQVASYKAGLNGSGGSKSGSKSGSRIGSTGSVNSLHDSDIERELQALYNPGPIAGQYSSGRSSGPITNGSTTSEIPVLNRSAPLLSRSTSRERVIGNLTRSQRAGLSGSGGIRNEEWDPDMMSSASAYSHYSSMAFLTTGQNVMNVDRRGIVRGPCSICNECEQYEVVNGLSCEYCGCPPGKHENLGLFPKTQGEPAGPSAPTQPSYNTLNTSQGTLNTSRPSFQEPQANTSQGSIYANSLPSRGPSVNQVYKMEPPELAQVLPKVASNSKLRPVSLMDLPGTMTVDDARRFLSLQRNKTTESDDDLDGNNSSCPDIEYKANSSLSRPSQKHIEDKRKNFNRPASSNSAYDGNSPVPGTPKNYRSTTPGESPQAESQSDNFENDSDDFLETYSPQTDRTSDTGVQDLDYSMEKLTTSKIPTCQIIAMNGGDVVRGMLKGEIQLIVNIIPNSVKKQNVMWFHNSRKINPRYRVRFCNDRREVHILSLRKKDAGVYKCQVKYSIGKTKLKETCTMVLDVQVPEFVAKG